MKRSVKTVVRLVFIVLVAGLVSLTGCKGSESREKVDEAVETMAGKKQVDQMNKMKTDVMKAQKTADERMKSQLEEDTQ